MTESVADKIVVWIQSMAGIALTWMVNVRVALSAIFQMLSSTLIHLGIYFNVTALRLLELGGLALFACFTICAITALKKT